MTKAYDPIEPHKTRWDSTRKLEERALKNLNEKFEEGDVVIICKSKSPARSLNRMTFLLDSMGDIATDKNLTSRDFRVLMYLLSQMDFENWIHLSLKALSLKLDIGVSHVSESVKNLVTHKYILKEKVGRTNFYRFNPSHGWKGKDVEWDKVVSLDEIRLRQQAKGSMTHRPGPMA